MWKKFLDLVVPHKPRVFFLGLGISILLTPLFALMGDEKAERQAYAAVSAFAPWNLVGRYFRIIFTSCDGSSPDVLCTYSPLSRHFPMALKPITALFDVVIQAFAVGPVGFVFALAQVVTGVVVMWVLSRPESPAQRRGFYFYLLGLPLGAMLVGSAMAIPFWVIGWFGLTVAKGWVGLSLQTLSVSTVCTTVCLRATESVTHHAAVQGVAAALKVDAE